MNFVQILIGKIFLHLNNDQIIIICKINSDNIVMELILELYKSIKLERINYFKIIQVILFYKLGIMDVIKFLPAYPEPMSDYKYKLGFIRYP